jgi:hypothetical protein
MISVDFTEVTYFTASVERRDYFRLTTCFEHAGHSNIGTCCHKYGESASRDTRCARAGQKRGDLAAVIDGEVGRAYDRIGVLQSIPNSNSQRRRKPCKE